MQNITKLEYMLAQCLGPELIGSIAKLLENGQICKEDISEIRIRAGRPASITCQGRNITLSATLSERELSECMTKLCGGSVYAHSDTVRMGYIMFSHGVRVGVCGTLAPDGRAVGTVTSLNIRIPHAIRGVCDGLYSLSVESGRISSMLIYSLPGVGKTTALRDLAAKLGEQYRVAVIDTRGELYIPRMFEGTLCDFLIGYPRAHGIEIAVRTMSPQVIICDELGDAGEAGQILSCVSTGVPIIASAHGENIAELISRPNIRMLHDGHVFSRYVGIRREKVGGRLSRSFLCDECLWEDAL